MPLLLLILACSDPDPTLSEQPLTDTEEDTASDTGDTGDTGDTALVLPSLADILDHSVNQASTTLYTDPDTSGAALWVQTQEGVNDAGGFNGAGIGNKAIAGIPGFDGLALSELGTVHMSARHASGAQEIYLNLLLDLACDGEDVRILVVTDLGDAPPDDQGYSEVSITSEAPIWRAVGGIDDILPGHLDPEPGSLTPVLSAYPAACLRDVDTQDGGMPANQVTRSVLWVLGDSSSNSANSWYIRALEVAGVRFEAP